MNIDEFNDEQKEALLAKLKKFIKLVVFCFFLVAVIGVIGGYLIWDSLGAGESAFGFEILMPTIVAAVIMIIVLIPLRKKMFPGEGEYQIATKLFQDSVQKK